MNTPRTQPVARRLFNLLLVLGLLSSLFAFQGASPVSAQVEEPDSIVENIFQGTSQTSSENGIDRIYFDNLTATSPDGNYVAYVSARDLGMLDTKISIKKADEAIEHDLVGRLA